MATKVDTAQREVVQIEHPRPADDGNRGPRTVAVGADPVFDGGSVHPRVRGRRPIIPERASLDTRHSHRGFDNLWYAISGSSSTGHSTGPGGAIERARLQAGSLLKLRTGRGVWHAEGIGEDELREGRAGTEMCGLFADAQPGTRFMLLAGKPYGEAPIYNAPYVD